MPVTIQSADMSCDQCSFDIGGTTISGICFGSRLCTVGSTIRLNLFGSNDWMINLNDYVGSPFLTCTNDGWFPHPPRCLRCTIGMCVVRFVPRIPVSI